MGCKIKCLRGQEAKRYEGARLGVELQEGGDRQTQPVSGLQDELGVGLVSVGGEGCCLGESASRDVRS